MQTEPRLNPPLPPPPKRAFLPKDRPAMPSKTPPPLPSQTERWERSIELLEMLNRSAEPSKSYQKPLEPSQKQEEPKAPQRLHFPWFFWATSLLFIATALLMLLGFPDLLKFTQFSAPSIASTPKERDLKENPTPPDPSSPTAENALIEEDTPSLRQPTKPSRN